MTRNGHTVALFHWVPVLLLAAVSMALGGTKIPAIELEQAVRQFLDGQREGNSGHPEVTFRSVPDNIEITASAYHLHVAGDSRTEWKGAIAVRVDIEADGRIVHRCMVSVLIRTYADVLVAEKAIQRHAEPGPDDVRTLRLETTLIQRRVLIGSSSLEGLRSRQIIPRGSILYEDLFERIPMVQRGERVKVHVRSGAVMLYTEGIVQDDGDRGDLVTVELASRHDRIRGRIDGEKCVTVQVDVGKEKR
jgi:flagella basal body P-ring formation protein FlgA